MTSLTQPRSDATTIPVFARYARAWPETDPAKPWRPSDVTTPTPIGNAFTHRYDFDAHTTAYAATVRYRASNQLLERPNSTVSMVLFVADVDAPEHEAPTPEWREREKAKRAALWARCPGFLSYDTRGGYRLVWRLSEALPLLDGEDSTFWQKLYVRWCDWLEREIGIVADRNCKDWTHLFRLPFVRRDGVDQVTALEGDLSAGAWDWRCGGTEGIANDTAATCRVIDETDGEPAAPEVVGPLLDRIVAELDAAGRWQHGRQAYFLPFVGWLLGKGWARVELEQLVERMGSKHHKYLSIVKRARALDGPPRELQGLLAPDGWARLDAIVNEHPNAVAQFEAWKAKRDADHAALADFMAAAVSQPSVAGQPVPSAVLAAAAEGAAGPKERRKPLTTAEVVELLSTGDWGNVIGFDALANRVVCMREPPMRYQDNPGVSCAGEWTDAHTARARTWIFGQKKLEPSKDATDAAVEIVARRAAFHPVQAYLASLRWDGVPRLDGLLSRYFGTDATEYTRQVGAKTLIAAVARATRPGCKVDTMTILEGAQGIGKSRSLRALAPRDDWFADTPLDLESKDAAQCLQGKWIYEIGELHSFNRSETTRIKAFVSSQSDNLRPSYGRRNQDFPRQCVFIGTTNGTEYLTDTTGNRRYWPVRCRAIDVAGIQCDRDQLWAEAAARYAAGERWWLEGSEVAMAEAQQADREAIDPWEQPLTAWLDGRSDEAFSMADVLTGALALARSEHHQANATRVGKLLARLGWRAKAVKEPGTGKVVRRYMRAGA